MTTLNTVPPVICSTTVTRTYSRPSGVYSRDVSTAKERVKVKRAFRLLIKDDIRMIRND